MHSSSKDHVRFQVPSTKWGFAVFSQVESGSAGLGAEDCIPGTPSGTLILQWLRSYHARQRWHHITAAYHPQRARSSTLCAQYNLDTNPKQVTRRYQWDSTAHPLAGKLVTNHTTHATLFALDTSRGNGLVSSPWHWEFSGSPSISSPPTQIRGFHCGTPRHLTRRPGTTAFRSRVLCSAHS